MKKTYLLIMMIGALACQSRAQNWTPLNTIDKYNYTLGASDVLSHTLWIDSTIKRNITSNERNELKLKL